ncbi:uncharacterized protein LOC131993967 [Stomoxys calcitrans]|uniref:uncharacterized protein LOC131993967 n=1 Tax=Stomoxys calcitrans TaxID=35570 RepID=UPI0027E39751|nr:uncharacterized protein LOC131993967 [Stomoxys calcitrans]
MCLVDSKKKLSCLTFCPKLGEKIDEHILKQSKLEGETLQQLLALEKEFREHNAVIKNELLTQKELISRMWVLSQRYILITSTGTCCKFPEIFAGPAEEIILQEYCEKLKALKTSNCRISVSLKDLRTSCRLFETLCSQLDMNLQTPFIIGDAYHKPLAFFIELVSDLFKYFHAWLLKLKYNSQLLDPYKAEGMEHYKTLIEPSEEFEEYLNMGLTYCKCLKPKAAC